MRNRHGFTLIELLIVVVIIGILSAIAIPKFASTKERAFLATMKSDLRNLVASQEAYLADNGAYYAGGIPNASIAYQPSSGTTITIVAVVAGGWSATAAYAGTSKTCAIFYGNSPVLAPATANGEPKCT